MGPHAELVVRVEELAEDLETATAAAQTRVSSPTALAALRRAHMMVAALGRFVGALDDDDLVDSGAVDYVTQAIRIARAAVERAQEELARAWEDRAAATVAARPESTAKAAPRRRSSKRKPF
jgi:hypothetical protein